MFAPFKCWRPPIFWPSFLRKIKNLTRLTSVLSLPFKFVQNHKSCPNSAASLLGLWIEAVLLFSRNPWKSLIFVHGEYVGREGGGASRTHKARLLIACGGGGGASNRPCPTYTWMHADLSFSYLRFAEAASFDKKKLRRSCTTILYYTILYYNNYTLL